MVGLLLGLPLGPTTAFLIGLGALPMGLVPTLSIEQPSGASLEPRNIIRVDSLAGLVTGAAFGLVLGLAAGSW
ncbi:hypothetical protein, partial [Streptomyces sp. NPDC127574]|uniref:hypothetical protein n=1 Tax=Streptomyces sp. NPDC127574 TaxID=3345401 RepID=UPI003642A1BC